MKNSLLILCLITSIRGMSQADNLFIDKFTAINPVSYTDVTYMGTKDTVLVSTFSGRIAKVIKGISKEKVITNIDDEIYALAYNKARKEIIASTLSNGILVINERDGKVIKKLPLASSWGNVLVCSDNNRFLYTRDQKGKRYIYDIQNQYTRMEDSLLPAGRILRIDKNNIATIVSSKKVILWNMEEKKKTGEWDIETPVNITDVNDKDCLLAIDFNECIKYNIAHKKSIFKVKHPNWLLPNPETDQEKKIFEIPYQMQLNTARFAGNYIYTAGIDRSVRVWEQQTGNLVTTLTGHKGSISKMKVSEKQEQVVTVDLKGVIMFWEVQ